MKTSESIKTIGAAMLNFQSEVTKIAKSAKNPFFKSTYAPLPDILETIMPVLQKHGLVMMQFPKGQNELETIILHPVSGEFMSESYYMKPAKEDPQAYGSVITYQRRYALGAILGLNIDEDDDGNKASAPQSEEPEKPWMSKEERDKLLDWIMKGKYNGKTADQVIKLAEVKCKIRTDFKNDITKAIEFSRAPIKST
jgi:hypothetical protein